jgi:hypothetical protein
MTLTLNDLLIRAAGRPGQNGQGETDTIKDLLEAGADPSANNSAAISAASQNRRSAVWGILLRAREQRLAAERQHPVPHPKPNAP